MSTTLPHGIIQINEGNIAWYGDITANWQLIDSKIGIYDAAIATIPAPANTGTLTINYGGTTIAMFGADDAGNVSADIPAPGDGTLTIQLNGVDVQTFTANQSTAATANITVPTAVSELANDSGYLTSSSNLDASKLTSGTVDIARLPQGALERLVKVANEAARYALTTADVQLGDTVQQLDTGIMYAVTDTDHLDSAAGYTEYTAGTAASVPWSGVTGKPAFATVATSGSYNDLSNKPTIPTVNNATLTIQKNGTNVQKFTANASSNVTANITVPTKTSDLTNDSGFVASADLSAVATSGSYNDLSNKPTIPTVNNATLTIQRNGTTVKTFKANASSNVTANITVPTKTSDLTNDSGFITSDNTKIPLAGSNAISGSLIPATDNSIDIGSSTKNIKMLYTKGITIDGKTIDTDANGNMVYDGHIVDTIEEQGTGYIRYTNGIQICYGNVVNNNNVDTGKSRFSFPKDFSAIPNVVVTPSFLALYSATAAAESGSTWVLGVITFNFSPIGFTPDGVPVSYVAVGRWK